MFGKAWHTINAYILEFLSIDVANSTVKVKFEQ